MSASDARALTAARAAVTHHGQTPVATGAVSALVQPLHSPSIPTATAMTTTTNTTISTTTTSTIITVATTTNAIPTTPAKGDRPELITTRPPAVTTPAIISFANQALEAAEPLMARLNQMQDRSNDVNIHSCLSSLQPIIDQLRAQHTLKGHRRNVYLVASIMMFYHGLLTSKQEVENINAVVRKLRELRRDPRED